MKLRKEVLNRLLLAKSILLPAIGAELNAYTVARQVLNAHDASDLVFAAIAEEMGVLPAKDRVPSMVECLRLIGGPSKEHEPYFKRLSIARDNLKHVGNLPSTQQWGNVVVEAAERLSDICKAMLDTSFQDVDEVDLLTSDEVREHLSEAKLCRASGEFRLALERVGKALFVTLDEHPNFWSLTVGRANAEDALKLMAYGVPASDFLRLQEFLPEVTKSLSGALAISWTQNRFGHPGNWHEEVIDFCIRSCLGLALKVQSAPAIPEAIEFKYRYEYRVTAKEDRVEVWEDLIEGHLLEAYGRARPFRTHVRYLSKGESITVPFIDHLVSFDLSLADAEISRVQVSPQPFAALGSMSGVKARAEFVALAQVDVTCVPYRGEIFGQHLPNLPEVPWEPDPAAHTWPPLDVVPSAELSPQDTSEGDTSGS